jgi:hypothetical protein
MAPSNYSILPIDTFDVPTLVEFLYSLKSTLAFNRAVFKNWPNEAAQKALYRATIENTLAPTSATESLKAADDETGEIIGYVAVSRERPTQDSSTEQQQKQHLNAEGTRVDGDRGQEQEQPEEELSAFNLEVYAAAVKACLELQRGVEMCDHFGMSCIPSLGYSIKQKAQTNTEQLNRNHLCWC